MKQGYIYQGISALLLIVAVFGIISIVNTEEAVAADSPPWCWPSGYNPMNGPHSNLQECLDIVNTGLNMCNSCCYTNYWHEPPGYLQYCYNECEEWHGIYEQECWSIYS